MIRTKIKEIFQSKEEIISQSCKVCGWVKTVRVQKSFAFLEINDGSIFTNLQIVLDAGNKDFSKMEKITTGASICVEGKIVKSPGKNQPYEMQASSLEIIGLCPVEEYPLQKKGHSYEFLRTIAHLRPRTNIQGAILRIRSALAFATHQFFHQKGFLYIHTPIITGSDCEGAGQLFRVTTLPDSKDLTQDFFKKAAFLTVSGQLEAEIFACALSDIYTFGPTFRAENSNTSRHLAEFWMIEPEMAFCDLKQNAQNAEEYLKFAIQYALTTCPKDFEFLEQYIEKGLIARLQNILNNSFGRVTYTEAIEILKKAKKSFEFPVSWGMDLQAEHERYLAEEIFQKPVFVTNYPKEIKAFYMRVDEDGKTVAAMDLLVPKVGELLGGSQREERHDVLRQKFAAMNLKEEDYWWYLELRKYGTCAHSGYGVGFERLLLFITGMENIRDVIPFPRYPGHVEF